MQSVFSGDSPGGLKLSAVFRRLVEWDPFEALDFVETSPWSRESQRQAKRRERERAGRRQDR